MKIMAVAYAGGLEGSHQSTMSGGASQRWFALQVRTRWEGSTAVLLSGKGYQTLLPTYRSKKHGREGVAPLFPGYVFCQFDAQNRLPVLITPGVISVVGRGRIPVPVDEAELAGIQTLVASGLPVEPWPYLELGQRIRIEADALKGLEGILINFKGHHRIVVSVSLLRRSVALEVDRASVMPLGAAKPAALDPVRRRPVLQGVVA
jgi:transcription antitermination factor NusG